MYDMLSLQSIAILFLALLGVDHTRTAIVRDMPTLLALVFPAVREDMIRGTEAILIESS